MTPALPAPVPTPPTLEERAADLAAVIRGAGCRRPVPPVYWEGGPIAITYPPLHPRSVRALVLHGTAAPAHWRES